MKTDKNNIDFDFDENAISEDVNIGNITSEQDDTGAKNRKKTKGKINLFDEILGGRFLASPSILKQIPFAIFISALAMVYIANNNYTEKTIRNIETTKKQIKELRAEYISLRSELNQKTSQSEVAARLEPYGIKESVTPPQKIFVDLKFINQISEVKTEK
jgi:hypothetical protein